MIFSKNQCNGLFYDNVKTRYLIKLNVHHHTIHYHDGVNKWKHFPRHWPFVRGIHRSPVNSPHKSQWRGALMFSLICAWINGWVNNREAGDLRRHCVHCDVIVMKVYLFLCYTWLNFCCIFQGAPTTYELNTSPNDHYKNYGLDEQILQMTV